MMRHLALAATLAGLIALGACGDDSDDDQAASSTTNEDALCDAVDATGNDIQALGDIDVVAEGTDAVEANLTTIRDDLAAIEEAAPDTAPDESEAFDSALSSLEDAINALGNESLTAASAQDVIAAGASTVEAGQAYLGALDDACP
jgi:hypothetical protein